ncbi:MAG: PD40 domain-containing protein, partial [Calditrichaeota bacterium]|nr:PD40 domain-containing protein [Calditrichota bacterium]
SPDGTRIAFVADDDDGQQLYVTRVAEATDPVRLDTYDSTFTIVNSFAWSPDATHIAFVAIRDQFGFAELLLAPATGGVTASVINGVMIGGGYVSDFRWSPDGRQIAFRANKIEYWRTELFATVPGFGAEPFLLSGDGRAYQVNSYDWSTEGDRVAYRAVLNNEDAGVMVADRYGNQV